MEKRYENVMETLAEQRLDSMVPALDCCTCDKCRSDIICIALNHLPVHYVATDKGALFTKVESLGRQFDTDLTVQISAAAHLVKEHPRHDETAHVVKN